MKYIYLFEKCSRFVYNSGFATLPNNKPGSEIPTKSGRDFPSYSSGER